MPKILFLSKTDNANYAHKMAKAINENHYDDWNATAMVGDPHPFFEQNARTIREIVGYAREFLKTGSWIFYSPHDDYPWFISVMEQINRNWVTDYNIAIRHSGSYFRQNPLFAQIIDRDISCCTFHHVEFGEHFSHDAKAFPYLHIAALPADGDKTFYPHAFHCPSNQRIKGTRFVPPDNSCIEFGFRLSEDEVRSLRARSHFCIDQFNTDMQSLGAMAIDSARAGCLPVLNYLGRGTMKSFEQLEIPAPPFFYCAPDKIHTALEMPYEAWKTHSELAQQWTIDHCSPAAQAAHITSRLLECA